jgi:hypothetical protein
VAFAQQTVHHACRNRLDRDPIDPEAPYCIAGVEAMLSKHHENNHDGPDHDEQDDPGENMSIPLMRASPGA